MARVPILASSFITAALAFAIGLFLIPLREATQPPEKTHWVLETLFPGTSPAWGLLGGLALVAWSCWLLHMALYRWTWGNSAIVTDMAIPNLTKAYGVPIDNPLDLWVLFRPSWILVYVMPAVVFFANLVIVWRARRPAGQARS